MKLLLDTHALIWFSEDALQLSPQAKQAIQSPENSCCVSMVSYWEMAIKLSLGKLLLQKPLAVIMTDIQGNYFDLLRIDIAHVLALETLPLHHRDPFDRMLIAQSITEDFTLVSNETLFDHYGVKRIW